MPKTAKKAKQPQPQVGVKVWVHDEHDILGTEYYHNDGEIETVEKDHIVVRLEVNEKGIVSKKDVIFNLNDYDLEDFWATFSVKKEQAFCYDPEFIWIANDGDGGVYSYDSEEACSDYAEKNDEESTINTVGRSEVEKAAPEMYVVLNRIRELTKDYVEGKAKGIELATAMSRLFPRMDSACAAIEKEEHLKDIIKICNIPAPV